MKGNKQTSITFRTREDLKNKLQAMADKENRTLSNMIEMLIAKAIETTKNKK
jgi:predicted transcriptional regulator